MKKKKNKYRIDFNLLGISRAVEVDAKSMKKAIKKVRKAPLSMMLKNATVGQYIEGYSCSVINKWSFKSATKKEMKKFDKELEKSLGGLFKSDKRC